MPHATRPKFLNLLQISLPIGALASVAHRVSGVLLALALPGLIYALALSLRDAAGYAAVLAWLDSPLLRPVLIVLGWSLFHHFLAGVRFLLLDMHIGVSLPQARASAWVVNGGALLLTGVLAVGLWQ